VLLLLPPSEGKAPGPRRGRPVDLERLSSPVLTPARAAMLDALVTLCSGDVDKAREVLGLSAGLATEVDRDRRLRTAPAIPVRDLYTGVLYDALGLGSLDPAGRRRAHRSVLVFSGLWGLLRLGDRVPPYRLSGEVSLPGIGPVAGAWRGPIDEAMTAAAGARGLVVDLRSTSYAALWRPGPALAPRVVAVRVLQERIAGDARSRVVVSHFNKATKGRLVRSLVVDGHEPRTPRGLAELLRSLGWVVEPGPRGSGLDVVVAEV
jgi:cytoplasmic iron level regulating protein YaaA (DUF328/UPF0246 family)